MEEFLEEPGAEFVILLEVSDEQPPEPIDRGRWNQIVRVDPLSSLLVVLAVHCLGDQVEKAFELKHKLGCSVW